MDLLNFQIFEESIATLSEQSSLSIAFECDTILKLNLVFRGTLVSQERMQAACVLNLGKIF